MAVIVKDDGVVSIDNAAGTPVEITNYVITHTVSVENTVGSYATLGSSWGKSTEGMRTWSAEIELLPEDASAGVYELFVDWMLPSSGKPGSRTLTVDVPDSATGSYRFTGECKIGNLDPVNAEGGSGDPANISPSLTGDGPLTKSVIA